MKIKLNLTLLALILSAFGHPQSTCLAQGSLAPPGAPAPTMKSLAQIEPRTPISSAAFIINIPGSYYLTTNLTVDSGNGVTIATNGVTLDLNGFTIASTAPSPSGYGIVINSGLRNLVICNGGILGGVTNSGSVFGGPGFYFGIYYIGVAPANTRISGVSVSGCQSYGIVLGSGDSTLVDSCLVRTVGGSGIEANTVRNSIAMNCGESGILGNQILDSRGESLGSGYGIHATDIAVGSRGHSNTGTGVYAYIGNSCKGTSTFGTAQSVSFKYNMP